MRFYEYVKEKTNLRPKARRWLIGNRPQTKNGWVRSQTETELAFWCMGKLYFVFKSKAGVGRFTKRVHSVKSRRWARPQTERVCLCVRCPHAIKSTTFAPHELRSFGVGPVNKNIPRSGCYFNLAILYLSTQTTFLCTLQLSDYAMCNSTVYSII